MDNRALIRSGDDGRASHFTRWMGTMGAQTHGQRNRLRVPSIALAAGIAMLTVAAGLAQPVSAGGFPVLFFVDTLADNTASDSHCSLREAIQSSNGFTTDCGVGSSG